MVFVVLCVFVGCVLCVMCYPSFVVACCLLSLKHGLSFVGCWCVLYVGCCLLGVGWLFVVCCLWCDVWRVVFIVPCDVLRFV